MTFPEPPSSNTSPNSLPPPILWWRENLDFILTALLILFLLRCYCFEFFQIPSQSMYPTLHGHPHFGDRILVNRAAYEFDFFTRNQIKRWDVIVFKYPPNTARDFVKRVTGLPEETIQVISSNIVINQKIAQKPPLLQEQLFFENGRSSKAPFFEFFQQQFSLSPKKNFQIDLATNGILVTTEEETAIAEYIPENGYLYDEDTRILLNFLPLKNTGFIQLSLGQGEERFSWQFGAEHSFFQHYHEEKRISSQPLTQHFQAGQHSLLKFQVLDGQVSATLDGHPVFSHDLVSSLEKKGGRFFQLDFFQTECKLLDIHLFYDIRYTQEIDHLSSWTLGKNEYYVCGDHSIESDDSRKWRKIQIQVNSEANTSLYEGDAEQRERMWKEKEVFFVDVFGKTHSFPKNAVQVSQTVPFPAVPKKYVLGKALWILWPFERIGWIR